MSCATRALRPLDGGREKKPGESRACNASASATSGAMRSRSDSRTGRIRKRCARSARERLRDHLLDLSPVDGLAQEELRAQLARLRLGRLGCLRRDDTDARVLEARILAHALDQLHAVEDGHVQIDEHE